MRRFKVKYIRIHLLFIVADLLFDGCFFLFSAGAVLSIYCMCFSLMISDLLVKSNTLCLLSSAMHN